MVRNLLHIVFAFTVLFSTSGYTLHKHYCGEELQDISVTEKTDPCCPGDAEGENECCRNESELQQIEENYIATAALELSVQPVILFLFPVFLQVAPENNIYHTEYLNYRPPLLDIDIPVSLQTFLC